MKEITQSSFDCGSAKVAVTEVPSGLSRRAALTAFAAALATVGLNSMSDAAYAAAKTYNICKTTDVNVGSARMFSIGGRTIVITQPKKGVFKAFSAKCTHAGANLASKPGPVQTQGTSMVCPQHGAKFDTTIGSVKGGPASRGLGKIQVAVAATQVKVTF